MEWTPSLSKDELPVHAAAVNFVKPIRRSPKIAA
jgi:hypothetical protein